MSRLARCLNTPDGMTVGEALLLAESALEMRRQFINREIDRQVEEVAALAPQIDRARPPPELRLRVYDLAKSIHSVAGTFDRDPLGAAAYCLCDLVDTLEQQERWDGAAVRVHVAALVALKDAARALPAVRTEMVDGLRRIVEQRVERRLV